MRIGIDARFFGPVGKGLGRYTQKLVEGLEARDHTNHYVVFLRKENFDTYTPQSENFTKVLADFRWYSIAEQWRFPHLLRRYDIDLMHFPHFNVPLFYCRPFVVTIHDLILLHFPTLRATKLHPAFYWIKFAAYRVVIWHAVHRARRIFAVSAFTKHDILAHYRVPEEKIVVTHEAAFSLPLVSQEKQGGEQASFFRQHAIIEPYLLYVGNAYPHKNLETLVHALEEIHKTKPELSLVLVGKKDFFYGRLRHTIERRKVSRIVILDTVSEEILHALYAHAAVFVFPSLYEGFGLPPLEAMTHGVPVVSSDHPCMREILGDSAFYADARDHCKFAKGIMDILTQAPLRNLFIKRGFAQVQKYSWARMVQQTHEHYTL